MAFFNQEYWDRLYEQAITLTKEELESIKPKKQSMNDPITNILVQEAINTLKSQYPELFAARSEQAITFDDIANKTKEVIRETLTPTLNTKFEALNRILRDFENKINENQQSSRETIVITKPIKESSFDTTEVEENIGLTHQSFKIAVNILKSKLPLYVYGPTGSGKTRSIQDIFEKVFKIPFVTQGVHLQTNASLLMGHMIDKYIPGAAFKPYTEGGALIVDEIDAGSPAINLCLNSLTNEWCNFPCGMFKKHKDFYLVATANTLGNGATLSYVGRAPQDKAMLNRFVFLNWPYDTIFERKLAEKFYAEAGGENFEDLNTSIDHFFIMRQAIEDLAINHILSSRNLFQLSLLKAFKVDKNTITRAVIARGLDKDSYEKVLHRANKIIADKESSVSKIELLAENSSDTSPF